MQALFKQTQRYISYQSLQKQIIISDLSTKNLKYYSSTQQLNNNYNYSNQQYLLKRIDDNGIEFVIDRFQIKTDAEARMRELTQYQHKQHYWIEELKHSNSKNIRDAEKQTNKY